MEGLEMPQPEMVKSKSDFSVSDLVKTDNSPHQLSFWKDYQFWNILGVSLTFMILYSSVYTCINLQASVLSELHDQYFNGTESTGYSSLAVTHAIMAAANWIAPSIIAYTGPKYGMFLGAVLYCLDIASFIRPFFATIYLGTVLVGIGGAVLYTAQGVFLTINSSDNNMSSMLWGNSFAAVEMTDHVVIDSTLRYKLFIVLLCIACVGTLGILLLRYPGDRDRGKLVARRRLSTFFTKKTLLKFSEWIWLRRIKSAFALLRSKDMLLLSATFAYSGIVRTFCIGVFGTSIHFTEQFGKDGHYLLGVSGVIVGLGEVIAGCAFGVLGSFLNRKLRVIIVAGGVVVQLICYLLIFLSFPAHSSLRLSNEETYITPNKDLALFCSLLLGIGDGAINTQIYSLLGSMYSGDSAPAFALFKSVQTLATAIGFLYSSLLALPTQLGILAGSGVISALTLASVEWFSHKQAVQSNKLGKESVIK